MIYCIKFGSLVILCIGVVFLGSGWLIGMGLVRIIVGVNLLNSRRFMILPNRKRIDYQEVYSADEIFDD